MSTTALCCPSDTVDVFDCGPGTWSIDTLSQARFGLAGTAVGARAVFAGGHAVQLGLSDVVDLYELPVVGSSHCSPGVPNRTGAPGVISAAGSLANVHNAITLTASQLPQGELGYFLASLTPGAFIPPGSQGVQCLRGTVARYVQPEQLIQGPTGSLCIDLTDIPTSPPTTARPGETWYFQCWHRDGGSSNFTDAVAIPLQ